MKKRGFKHFLTALILSGIISAQCVMPVFASEADDAVQAGSVPIEETVVSETESVLESETETEVVSETAEGIRETETEVFQETVSDEPKEPVKETESLSETETEAESELKIETETKTETETETEAESETETETETETEAVLLGASRPADAVTFADQALSKAMLAKYDANKDGYITKTELSKLTSLSLPKAGITNLSGLEFAVNLRSLNLSGNGFSSLKVLASMKKLQDVNLSSNKKLKTLNNLKSLPKLKTANLSGTGISDKDILAFAAFSNKTLYKSSKVSLFSKYGPNIFNSGKKPSVKFLSGSKYIKVSSFDKKSGAFSIEAKKPGKAKIRVTYGTAHVDLNVTVENRNISPSAPKLSSLTNDAAGITVKWKTVKGASEYWIYRKVGNNGKWTRITKIENGKTTSWTDKSASKNGTKYVYYVKGVKKYNNVFCYSRESNHIKTYRLTLPTVSAQSAAGGMQVKWTKVSGATGYIIYRKAGSESKYTQVKKISNNTTFSWADPNGKANGTYYKYTVKAYKTVDKVQYNGVCGNISGTCFLSVPKITVVKPDANDNVVIKWSRNSAASGYQIVYADNVSMKNSKTMIISTNATVTATIPKSDKSKQCYIKICCFKKASGKTYYSLTSVADDRYTEAQLRSSLVDSAAEYNGTAKGSDKHKEILSIYNSLNPLPVNYKMTVNDPWCAAFATAMAVKTRLNDLIPGECSCSRQIKLWQGLGRWQENDAYVPKAGDYIYYNWSDTGKGDCKSGSDHVGIVVSVKDKTIKVIEGNRTIGKDKNGKAIYGVGYREIQVNGRYIRGYGLANFASKAVR